MLLLNFFLKSWAHLNVKSSYREGFKLQSVFKKMELSANLCSNDFILILKNVLQAGLAVCDPCSSCRSLSSLTLFGLVWRSAHLLGAPSLFYSFPSMHETSRNREREFNLRLVTERCKSCSRAGENLTDCEPRPCGGISMFRPCWLLIPASWETKQTPTTTPSTSTTSTSQLLN